MFLGPNALLGPSTYLGEPEPDPEPEPQGFMAPVDLPAPTMRSA